MKSLGWVQLTFCFKALKWTVIDLTRLRVKWHCTTYYLACSSHHLLVIHWVILAKHSRKWILGVKKENLDFINLNFHLSRRKMKICCFCLLRDMLNSVLVWYLQSTNRHCRRVRESKRKREGESTPLPLRYQHPICIVL